MSVGAGPVVTGRVVEHRPHGAGDFADAARAVADALGNAPGVRAVEVERRPTQVRVHVTADSAGYVGQVAAAHGWQLFAREGRYAFVDGPLGGAWVHVLWLPERPEDPDAAR
jgi:hypothetical protein